jgi:hypothetical protein
MGQNAPSTAEISDTHAPPAKASTKFNPASVPVPISYPPEKQLHTSDAAKMMALGDQLSKQATSVRIPIQEL